MSLRLFVSVSSSDVVVSTTQMKTRQEVQDDSADSGSDEKIWDLLDFEPKHEGVEILEALAVTSEVQNTLEEFATAMFKWGQRFERERLRKQLGLNDDPTASDQSAK